MANDDGSGGRLGRQSSDSRSYHNFDVSFVIADVTRLLRSAFDVRLRRFGLTGSTLRVVFYLSRTNGLSQAELASHLEITRAAVGEAIDRLELGGFVERVEDYNDRRNWKIILTESAHSLLAEMFDAADELQRDCFGRFTDEELYIFQGSLAKLRATLIDL